MVRGASQGASTRLRSVSTSSRSFAFFLLSFIAFKANHSLADRRRRDEYGFECGLVRTPGTAGISIPFQLSFSRPFSHLLSSNFLEQ